MTAPGSVGRYAILREIGRGGVATVYLARQTDLDRLVALKELSALAAADATTTRRFVRESRLAGSLNHPNIVTVHDFFEHRSTPYIAMEYLERGSLRRLMSALTFAQIAGVIEGLLAGLAHAHTRGIVHRDVKPENLMISGEARVKIADFGIAKATDAAHGGTFLTATGTTIGTPTYMAPEQAMGQQIGPWTDLYAVGMIAFELLAGRPPFDSSGTPMAILLRHVNEQPLALTALDPSADPRISEWIDALLATEPEDRTESAATAWLAFEEIVLDRLGSRWRRDASLGDAPGRRPPPVPLGDAPGRRTPPTRAAALGDAPARRTSEAPAHRTPPTAPLAGATRSDERAIPTAMPLAGVNRRDERAIPTAMPRRAATVAAAARPSRRADGRRLRALARSLVLLMALAVAIAAGLAIAPGDSPPRGGRAPARGAPQRHHAPSGVGDSRSDDPSDDQDDGAEP